MASKVDHAGAKDAAGAGRRAGGGRRLLASLALAALTLSALAPGASARLADGAKPLQGTAPKVTTQPKSVSVEAGQSASFTANASGSPTPTVQWEVSTDGGTSFTPIDGATSGTYTIPAVTAAENGDEFRAVFTNSNGSDTSKAATLTVLQAPKVTQQPQNTIVPEGQVATFQAAASGSPAPTVRWQSSVNGGLTWKNIAGATSTTLKFGPVKASESNTEVRAVFSNSSGEAISEAATLTVAVAPKVTLQPNNATVEEGHTASFEANATGTPSPTIQWEVSADGGATWTPIAEANYPLLFVKETTAAMSGYEYRASFENLAGTVYSNTATLTVQSAPVVTSQPESTMILVGESASFEAAAKGLPTPTVQWESSTDHGASWTPVGGATSDTLTIADAKLSQNATEYRAAFSNAAGTTYSVVVTLTVSATDYSAYGWGLNTHGQVGVGSSESQIDSPMPIHRLSFVTSVSAGGRHSLALLANGTVYSWGYNAHGQLGDEGVVSQKSPILVERLSGVKAIAAGGSHSLALLEDGTVMAWGDNESGQLGDGKTAESEVPVQVKNLTGVVAIAAGEEDSLALLEDGTVMAWGNNERGQLGTGGRASEDTPTAVKGLSGVKAIAAGAQFSLALLEGGTVAAWGDDEHDQLGNAQVLEKGEKGSEGEEPEGTLSRVPVEVEGLSGVKSISAGAKHALALMTGGSVKAWGDDSEGELGNGSVGGAVDVPAEVPGLSHVAEVSAGGNDSVALLESGSLLAWGTDEHGQLGLGKPGSPSDVPVAVDSLGQAAGVSAGGSHMLAFGASAPAVTGVSPQAGPATGGNSVTISGEGFGGASAVHFGSVQAPVIDVESPTTIKATAPAGSGTVDVTVTGPTGTSPAVAADRYTYRQLPTVTKLSAKGGSAKGGTPVTITGTEFTGATAVSFGGVPGSEVTVVSATTITAVSPASVAGTVDVRVIGVGGTSPVTTKDHFKYTPLIEGVSPGNGPLAGGTSVTVTGAGFAPGTGTTSFKFGKSTASTVECASETTCTMISPKGKATGVVSVVASVGKVKSSASPAAQFTYE